jgi:uncharacterized protein YqeY
MRMGIFDEITVQMKDALRAQETARLTTLRSIRASFLNEMKKDNAASLTDETCVDLLRRLEKQRKESIEAFEAVGRTEQAAAETAELAVIRQFLPSLADEETTRRWVKEVIAATGASGGKDVGRVMGAVMKAHRGEVDGTLARQVAAELLGD